MNIRFQFAVVMLAGWINRHQQAIIDYLTEEKQVLLEQLGGKPNRFSDSQRRRLALKAKEVSRHDLLGIQTMITPDTLRRWLRKLVALKWTFSKGRPPGRPMVDPEIERLVLNILTENPGWGSDKVVGTHKNLGYSISDTTIDNIRKRNGIAPAPEREKKTNWNTFLKAHWEGLMAADFFTTEVMTLRGLVTYYTLFVIDVPRRLVHICGTTVTPDEVWMKQIARNLTDAVDGFAIGKTHLILDRDTKFCATFKEILEDFKIDIVLIPPKAPKCNAVAERWVKSIKYECLNQMIFFGESHLKTTIFCYRDFYNERRNHQGVGNELLTPRTLATEGEVRCDAQLGGMLNYYYREAA